MYSNLLLSTKLVAVWARVNSPGRATPPQGAEISISHRLGASQAAYCPGIKHWPRVRRRRNAVRRLRGRAPAVSVAPRVTTAQPAGSPTIAAWRACRRRGGGLRRHCCRCARRAPSAAPGPAPHRRIGRAAGDDGPPLGADSVTTAAPHRCWPPAAARH